MNLDTECSPLGSHDAAARPEGREVALRPMISVPSLP